MKQNTISDLPALKSENMENIFNVYQDENGMYFYNLLQTITFPTDLPFSLFESYTIKSGDTWPMISYKTLNSTNIWWVLLLVNHILNPVIMPEPGTILKIPKPQVVKEILAQMRNQ